MNEPKRLGRPPLDPRSGVPSANLHVRLPAGIYDQAHAAATARRESVQDLIRRELSRVLKAERG